MYYTIYKTYNLINGKEYIGKHQTQNINDKYIGSGRLIQRAITKYGEDNFVKDILYVFNNEEEMNNKEKELVTEEYISSSLSYNLCFGGYGGFGYINENFTAEDKQIAKARSIFKDKIKNNLEFKAKWMKNIASSKDENYSKRVSKSLKLHYKENGSHWTGKTHKEETKRKIGMANSIHQKGEKNSQYGRPRTEETKRKISESLKKKHIKV